MSSVSTENIERFRRVFIEIEQHLRAKLHAPSHENAVSLIQEAAKQGLMTSQDEGLLRELARLRNNLSHVTFEGDYLAVPQDAVIARIERVRDHLLRPKRVQDKFLFKVESAQLKEPLLPVLERMQRLNISQVPVYADDNEFKGLMTTNAVARWLAAQKSEGIIDLEPPVVGDVLPFVEVSERYAFVKRDLPLMEVVQMFNAAVLRGEQLLAVVVTHSGQANQAPLGLIAVSDIPTALAEIDGRRS